MELILRKRLTGDLVRLSGARVLCRSARKLALLAPYPGQWVFYGLVAPGSSLLRYNRQPAPARCPLEVGDLLNLDGLELVVDSLDVDSRVAPAEATEPTACEIEVPGEAHVRISDDRLIGHDPSGGFCQAQILDKQPLSALLTFAAGRWHLHDLNGSSLVRNGKASGSSLVLVDGDRIRIGDKEVVFRIGAQRAAGDKWWVGVKDTSTAHRTFVEDSDTVYPKAKDLCRRLLPILRDGGSFRAEGTSTVGIRNWLRLLRRPSSPAETLQRLELLLSGSPRDRVWLLELCRFLYQQSYIVLSLRVARALCRLYPLDGELMQTLAKLYYRQAHNPLLSALERLKAFEAAEKCAGLARRLLPSEPMLADLQQTARAEQKVLRGQLAEMALGNAPLGAYIDAIGGRK